VLLGVASDYILDFHILFGAIRITSHNLESTHHLTIIFAIARSETHIYREPNTLVSIRLCKSSIRKLIASLEVSLYLNCRDVGSNRDIVILSCTNCSQYIIVILLLRQNQFYLSERS